MKNTIWFALVASLIGLLATVGCGSPATPTKPAATVPPQVITVVITPTALPPTATPAQPTITPIPTLVITPTVAVATPVTVKPTTAPVTPKAVATKKPVTGTITSTVTSAITGTVAPFKYGAPTLVGPVLDPNGRKDQVVVGAEIVFEWRAVGSLGENECYAIRVDINPGGGDTFLQCDSSATQAGQNQTVKYQLYRPGFNGPSYSGLLASDTGSSTVSWSVQVVKDNGAGTPGSYAVDGTRHKTTQIGAKSATFTFPLYGNK